jgi:hypothetical protein
LSNAGNLIYWLYLFTLPMGPVWFLHGFNTLVAGLMLVGYLHYQGHNRGLQPVRERGELLFGSSGSCACSANASS